MDQDNPQKLSDVKKVYIYNPLDDDFVTTYDINEDALPITFTIPSKQVASFVPIVADHIKNHLAKKIVGVRGTEHTNYEDAYKKALTELEVNLDE